MRSLLIGAGLPFVFLGTAAAAKKAQYVKVDQMNTRFVDEVGRSRVFHGFNVVYKPYPYLPGTSEFDAMTSFADEDIDNLKAWGATVVRLGVMWEAVEASKGEFDDGYLRKIEKIVNKLGKNGINTIIDSHQNLFSSDTCGNGVPPHYIKSL
jgi:endoglycosylceramidase